MSHFSRSGESPSSVVDGAALAALCAASYNSHGALQYADFQEAQEALTSLYNSGFKLYFNPYSSFYRYSQRTHSMC
jgi:hypothetical protein